MDVFLLVRGEVSFEMSWLHHHGNVGVWCCGFGVRVMGVGGRVKVFL